MVAIAPFRALRYDPARVDLAKVTSLPHDCISTAQRDAYLAADGRNIVKVVLGPEAPGDNEPPTGPNKFTRAADALRAWQADGTMRRDARPAFYLYEIMSGTPDARRKLSALVARVRLDPTHTEVRRHEKTLQRKKRERLHLREASVTDTEPIWLLYRDQRAWVEEILRSNALEELLRFTDEEGHEHRLWRVDRPEAVTEIVAQFDDRTLVIADGHHRYQTALDHHAATGKSEHGSILACLVRDDDAGTRIEATHRLVHGLSFGVDEALKRATMHWTVTPAPLPASTANPTPAERALVTTALARVAAPAGSTDLVFLARGPKGLQAHRLALRPTSKLDSGRGRLDTLAVSLLHERLLRDAWGLDLDKPEENLRFTRNLAEAVDAVATGACQLAVIPPPEAVSSVLEVAQQGHVMPQKATYFVPKLRSGVVLGPLDEAPPVPWRDIAGDGGKAQWSMPRL